MQAGRSDRDLRQRVSPPEFLGDCLGPQAPAVGRARFRRKSGVDAVRYDGGLQIDLKRLEDGSAMIGVAVGAPPSGTNGPRSTCGLQGDSRRRALGPLKVAVLVGRLRSWASSPRFERFKVPTSDGLSEFSVMLSRRRRSWIVAAKL